MIVQPTYMGFRVSAKGPGRHKVGGRIQAYPTRGPDGPPHEQDTEDNHPPGTTPDPAIGFSKLPSPSAVEDLPDDQCHGM